MATDSFSGGNANPIGGAWTTAGSFGALRVVSGEVANASGTDTFSAAYHTSTQTSSQIVIQALGSGSNTDAGPAICLDSSGNGYCFHNAANFQLYIFRLPSFATAANVAGSNFAVNDIVRIRRSGNDVIGSVNGVDVITATNDTTFTTGNSGITAYHGAFRGDDWTDGAAGGATIYNRSMFDSPIFGSRLVR
jgi:hypothetical protein